MKKLVYISMLMFTSTVLHAQTTLDSAANFTVKDVEGVTHYLNEYLEQGKIVVIDFFTITCGPCSTYAPLISESYNHFGCNLSNVVFLGINWGADNASVINFGITYGARYPEISGTEGNGNHVVADYEVLSYPTVILILPDSRIAENYIWPPTTQNLDSIISGYGGILAECNTPSTQFHEAELGQDKILSVYPSPAHSEISVTTSVAAKSSLEIYSLSGYPVINNITVFPSENTLIITDNLPSGYYMLVLRNKNGIVIDRKPIIIQ